MSEQEFCLLHGYEFMEKKSANRFNEYDLCAKCEEERAVQAPADLAADAVRSPEGLLETKTCPAQCTINVR